MKNDAATVVGQHRAARGRVKSGSHNCSPQQQNATAQHALQLFTASYTALYVHSHLFELVDVCGTHRENTLFKGCFKMHT